MSHWHDDMNEPSGFRRRDPRLLRAAVVCFVLALVCGYFAVEGHCQELLQPKPVALKAAVASYVAFSVIDAGQTGSCLSAGRCREANPLLRPFAGKPSALVTAKLAANSGVAVAIWRLRKTHPKAALALAITATGFQSVVVAQNVRVRR